MAHASACVDGRVAANDDAAAAGTPTNVAAGDALVAEVFGNVVGAGASPDGDAATLVAEGVTKRYFRAGRSLARHFDAVADASLALRSGELTCLTGRSGSGKTTLANVISGLLAPDSGSVSFRGQSLYDLDDRGLSQLRNRSFGIVAQGQSALHALTVIENVTLPWHLCARDGSPDAKAFELLSRLGIAKLADAYPAELSGGELRRMAIARALVCEPAVVVADEPTGDLDDVNTALVLGLLRAVADDGAAVLVVTHEHGVERYADHLLNMNAGCLSLGSDD